MTDFIGVLGLCEESRASRDDEAISILTIATQPPEGEGWEGRRRSILDMTRSARDNFLHDGMTLGLAEDDSFDFDSFNPLQMAC
jgi:hypothetical protein